MTASCALQSRAALDTTQCAYPNMWCTRCACVHGGRSRNLLGPSYAESQRKANEQHHLLCSGVN